MMISLAANRAQTPGLLMWLRTLAESRDPASSAVVPVREKIDLFILSSA